MDFFLGCNRWWIAAAVAAAAAAAFQEAGIFTALWRQRFPDACWKVWPSFQRCSNLANHTRDTPRNAWKIRSTYYRSSLPSCAILNLNSPSTNCQNSSGNSPEYSMIVLVLGDVFEFFLQFCWSKSTDTFSFLLIFLMGSLAIKWCFCQGSWVSRLRMFHPCGNS